LVQNIAPDIRNKYKEQTMGTNWYDKIKISQVIPVCDVKEEDPEIHKGPKPITKSKYRVGMRVRDRRKGLANPQEFGVVDSVQGDIVKIVWNPNDKNKRREEKFNAVEDTETLSLIVAEV
jgi:hypothetical protein